MARPKRRTVDYFPHFCKSGRTIYILENLYGNDGYAFWFKLLELLGESEGHYYRCCTASNWAFLIARSKVSEEKALAIISTLIELGKIDDDLWNSERIIWVPRFVENLADLYGKRATEMPRKPSFRGENPTKTGVFGEKTKTTQSLPATTSSEVFGEKTPESGSFRGENPTKTGVFGEKTKTTQSLPATTSSEVFGEKTPESGSFRGENYQQVAVFGEKTTSKQEFSGNLSAKDSIVKERIEKDSRLLPAHTCEAVVDAWNTILGDHLPKVQTLTEGRKEALKARLEELSSDTEEAVGMLTEAFEKVKQSTFLLGDNDRGWSATFDWVIQSADKLAKIIEGVYDDHHGTNRKATNSDIALGVDEWIESGTGRRTYGTGSTTIPTDAPPRPSARHQWDAASGLWILI